LGYWFPKEVNLNNANKVSGEEKRLERIDLAEIKDFFDEKFCLVTDPEPGTALEDYIHGYAKIAEFLSNTTAFREAATSLSTDLALLGTPLFTANVRGAFLHVVGAMAEAYGFSSEIYTLNGKVDPNDFANVLKQKVLFRDTYTRPHGEYSHLIQWLCVARQFDGILNVPVLYKDSVNFACRKGSDFGTLGGKRDKTVTLWNCLVDCFPTDRKGSGPENYQDNIFADTFRCPQYLTFNLGNPPSSTQLSAYIHNKALLGRNSSTIELPPGNRYQGPTGHVKSRIVRSREYLQSHTVNGELTYEIVTRTRNTPTVLRWRGKLA
jgi:Family of unknown function (DUF5636)